MLSDTVRHRRITLARTSSRHGALYVRRDGSGAGPSSRLPPPLPRDREVIGLGLSWLARGVRHREKRTAEQSGRASLLLFYLCVIFGLVLQ